MNLDFKRSIFLENQIPQFIRNEYPLFVEFLKQYYSFLDSSVGQLICVKVDNPGRSYSSNPVIQAQLLDTNPDSGTFNQYIADYKGAIFEPFVVRGRLEKIRVTSYGSGYVDEDKVRIVISDTSGSGATATPIIVNNLGNINESTKRLINTRDLDEEIPVIQEFIINEFVPNFPKNLYSDESKSVELTKFIRFIKQFYNSSGIEDSITFLYRILFNTTVDFYYPKNDMLRVSDGRWNIDTLTRIVPDPSIPSYDDFVQLYTGARIVSGCGCSSIIQKIVDLGTGEYELTLSNVHQNFQSPTGVNTLFNYPITGIAERIGNTVPTPGKGVIYQSDGYYLDDRGQPSSSKKIQDSFYYQDFSYELQSDSSIKDFKNLLEDIIHPAGLIYFIRLNLEAAAAFDVTNETEVNYPIDADDTLLGILDQTSDNLGPIKKDIDLYKKNTIPNGYIDISGQSILTSNSSVVINDIGSMDYLESDFLGYSIIITQSDNTWYRKINSFDVSSGSVTLDNELSNPTPELRVISYRIIDNLRLFSVNNSSSRVFLAPEDPGINYNNTDVDLKNHLYVNWRLYITSGPGLGQHRTIISFNSNTGEVVYNSPFTTAPTTDSTYWIYPDLYNNSGYWTSSVSELAIINGGSGYTADNSTFINESGETTLTYKLLNITTTPKLIDFELLTSSTKTIKYLIQGSSASNHQISDLSLVYNNSNSYITEYAIVHTSTNPFVFFDTIIEDGLVKLFAYTNLLSSTTLTIQKTTGSNTIAYNPATVVIDPPPSGTRATATATLSGGSITQLNISNPGSGYIFPPLVKIIGVGNITNEAIAVTYLNKINSNSYYKEFSYSGGVVININNPFRRASAYARLLNNSVVSVDLIDSGFGYDSIPKINFKGGGSQFPAEAYVEISANSISQISLINNGVNYESAPIVEIDSPTIRIGEIIYQNSTGARGTIQHYDESNGDVYVIKDTYSPDFELADVEYRSFNFTVNTIKTYDNTGEIINELTEPEINIIGPIGYVTEVSTFTNDFGETTYESKMIGVGTLLTTLDFNELIVGGIRSIKYLIQASSGSNHQISDISLIHNNSESFITEYAVTHTSVNPFVYFSSDIEDGRIKLNAYSTLSSTSIRIQKTIIG
jgi:hypothetical protein